MISWFQKAEEQYQRTCKKFGQSSKVWTLFSEYYLRKGDLEDSRKLLPRCLQSLDKRKRKRAILGTLVLITFVCRP
jgi:rRNA biogenesis protein RRP5